LALCLDSPAVSCRHAYIIISRDAAVMQDLGKNGAYLYSQWRLSRGVAVSFWHP